MGDWADDRVRRINNWGAFSPQMLVDIAHALRVAYHKGANAVKLGKYVSGSDTPEETSSSEVVTATVRGSERREFEGVLAPADRPKEHVTACADGNTCDHASPWQCSSEHNKKISCQCKCHRA